MTGSAQRTLVIAAHGSSDPAFATVVEDIASQVRLLRPGLDVRVGYLDHGPPHVRDVAADGGVVVPLLLSSGYHVAVDIPQQAPRCVIAPAIGPDLLLAQVMQRRLNEAGWDGAGPVVLAAAGSSDDKAATEVRNAAGQLAQLLGVDVTAGFVTAATPRLSDLLPTHAVATYLLSPGRFADQVAASAADVVGAPIGTAPEVARLVMERYATPQQDSEGA